MKKIIKLITAISMIAVMAVSPVFAEGEEEDTESVVTVQEEVNEGEETPDETGEETPEETDEGTTEETEEEGTTEETPSENEDTDEEGTAESVALKPITSWNLSTSKSKSATNLSDDFTSEVTLSLPSAEETLVTDVVFVLDESSCSEPVKAEVADLLDNLYKQVEKTGATIKIGAVQFRGEVTELPLTVLSAGTKDDVTSFMGKRPETGGSNMSAGLIAGEAMLDEDTAVDNSRKYLILVSDGITYIWDDATTAEQENRGVNFANQDTPNKPMLASPDGWDVKNGNKFVPAEWSTYLSDIGAKLLANTIKEKASLYVRNVDISDKPFVSYSEKDSYASTVDIALFQSSQIYADIAKKYAHTYAITAGVEGEMATYPFGPSFMKYLANGKTISFNDIYNEIVYLVGPGSSVTDYMGYVENDYDFDFVNDAASLSLSVGDAEYSAEVISENKYGFKSMEDGSYAFVLTYSKGNGKDEEHFVWEINENITNFAPVQLTYKVQLTNPKTASGTYGVYDQFGKNGNTGLYTNNEAVLNCVDTSGTHYSPEDFLKPTVSYEVKAIPVVTPTPTNPDPEPSKQETPTLSFEVVNTGVKVRE